VPADGLPVAGGAAPRSQPAGRGAGEDAALSDVRGLGWAGLGWLGGWVEGCLVLEGEGGWGLHLAI